MEYPTLFTGSPSDPLWDHFPFSTSRFFELTAVHEFVHQYFYGVIATDEREEAFLDEGLSTYWEGEILDRLFPDELGGGTWLGRPIDSRAFRTMSVAELAPRIRDPIRRRPSFLTLPRTRRAQVYNRPALVLATAEALFGERALELFFREWYRRGAFAHPDTDELLRAAELAGGSDLAAFLGEALVREQVPDFAVTHASTRRRKPPRGHVPSEDGTVHVTTDNRENHAELGLDPRAREDDGEILLEVRDPGWDRNGERAVGRIERRRVRPARGAEQPLQGDAWFESRVRVEGPAWDHLPVQVELTFDDGVLVRDPWDAKASWRSYRFVRRARLVDARIGPDDRLAVDVRPDNDGRRVEPDPRALTDWSTWLATLAQWFVAGVTLWL